MADIEDWPGFERRSLTELNEAQTLEALKPVVSNIGRVFGFRFHKIYKAPIPRVDSLRALILFSDLPDSFLSAFDLIGYSADEMEQMRALGETQLSQWTLEHLLEDGHSDRDRRLAQLVDEIGIGRGVYVNIAPVDGPARILSFLGRKAPLTDREAEYLTVVSIHILHRVNGIQKRHDWEHAGLTSLERESLALAAQGHEAQEIGRRLGLSGRTVLYITSSICTKLEVSSLDEAVAEAIRCGFIA